LIYCKNLWKCHSVPTHSTIIKEPPKKHKKRKKMDKKGERERKKENFTESYQRLYRIFEISLIFGLWGALILRN
jgi:uncharacterized membrane protein